MGGATRSAARVQPIGVGGGLRRRPITGAADPGYAPLLEKPPWGRSQHRPRPSVGGAWRAAGRREGGARGGSAGSAGGGAGSPAGVSGTRTRARGPLAAPAGRVPSPGGRGRSGRASRAGERTAGLGWGAVGGGGASWRGKLSPTRATSGFTSDRGDPPNPGSGLQQSWRRTRQGCDGDPARLPLF